MSARALIRVNVHIRIVSIRITISFCWKTLYAHTQHTLWICTRILSIRLKFVCVCSAYVMNLYAHTQHTLWICTRILSIRLKFVCVCSANALKLYAYADHTAVTSRKIKLFVSVCSANALNLYAYTQHTSNICMRILSIRIQLVGVCSACACETRNEKSLYSKEKT